MTEPASPAPAAGQPRDAMGRGELLTIARRQKVIIICVALHLLIFPAAMLLGETAPALALFAVNSTALRR